MAGSQQLPPRPALASGSPVSCGPGSCSSATRFGHPASRLHGRIRLRHPRPPRPDLILDPPPARRCLRPGRSDLSRPLARGAGRGLTPLLLAWGEGGASRCGGTWHNAGSEARTAELGRGRYLPLTLSWVAVKDGGKGGGFMFPADARDSEIRHLVNLTRYLLNSGRDSSSPAYLCH